MPLSLRGAGAGTHSPFTVHFWCYPPQGASELLFVSKKWEQKAQPLPKSCSSLRLASGSPFALETPGPRKGRIRPCGYGQQQQLNTLKKGCTEDMSGCY